MFTKTVARLRIAQRDDEQGFTLIELMVVVLIIAILIAIAIPTFLGARARAQDRAAQSSLRIALTAAKTSYTDNSDYSKATNAATDLPTIEPSLQYVAAGTASTDVTVAGTTYPSYKVISVAVSNVAGTDQQVWAGAALSKSGKCFWIHDVGTGAGAGTFFGTGGTCTGTAALAAAAGSF
jgi:type IV pilus assembly protein PilA